MNRIKHLLQLSGIFCLLFLTLFLYQNCDKEDGKDDETEQEEKVDKPTATISEITVTGLVDIRGEIDPAKGTQILISSDVDGNNQFEASEKFKTTTNDKGEFQITVSTKEDTSLLFHASLEGYTPYVRKFKVSKKQSKMVLNGTLNKLKSIKCKDQKCTNESGDIEVSGVSIAGGYAKAFNPVTETEAFPGDFADSDGNALISGVFGTFQLKDENNANLVQLPEESPATIRMKLPTDTWEIVKDIELGNDQIDVPMYSFNEKAGEWERDGVGWLENNEGEKLTEDQLPSIKNKSFEGVIFTVAKVTHFSTWNCDWPVDALTLIKGIIVELGKGIIDAIVNFITTSITGRTGIEKLKDGSFSFSSPRSEFPGEDINQDGLTGKPLIGYLQVVSGGNVFNIPGITSPKVTSPRYTATKFPPYIPSSGLPPSAASGPAPSGGNSGNSGNSGGSGTSEPTKSTDVIEIPTPVYVVAPCKITGQIQDHDGAPIANTSFMHGKKWPFSVKKPKTDSQGNFEVTLQCGEPKDRDYNANGKQGEGGKTTLTVFNKGKSYSFDSFTTPTDGSSPFKLEPLKMPGMGTLKLPKEVSFSLIDSNDKSRYYGSSTQSVDLFPGLYKVEIQGVLKSIEIKASETVELELGEIEVPGEDGIYLLDENGKELKFIGSSERSIDVFPGNYQIKINSTIGSVTVLNGETIQFPLGVIEVPGEDIIYLLDENGKELKFIGSSDRSIDVFPGAYQIKMNDATKPVTVTAGETSTVNFP